MDATDLPPGFVDDDPSATTRRKEKVEDRHVRKGDTRRRRQQLSDYDGNDNNWMLKFGLLMLVVLIASYFLVVHHERQQMEHLRQDIIRDEIQPLSKEWQNKYATLEEENKSLKQQSSQWQHDEMLDQANLQRRQEELEEETSKREKDETQIEYLTKYKSAIQKSIQDMSKTLLLEKFGDGPHQVEVNVAFAPAFPTTDASSGKTGRIVIQLASVEEMPHVVYFFLEQVSRGLFDGCSFHRNAGHVVQGGPAPNFLSPPNPLLYKRFRASGFNSILFQEYSPTFPHKKYTMGYAGRPGGPDFYFSTKDNSRLHGPGGQTSYDDPSEADACFAKVVEGFEVVDRMALGPTKPGGYRALEDNVAIASMKILTLS